MSDDTKNLPTPKAQGSLIPGGELDAAAADLVRALLNEPAKAMDGIIVDLIGGLAGDRIRQWRHRNLVVGLSATAKSAGSQPQRWSGHLSRAMSKAPASRLSFLLQDRDGRRRRAPADSGSAVLS